MSLVNLVRSVTFKVALGVGGLYALGCDASSGNTGVQYCVKDNECKGDRLCIDGKCEGSSDGSGEVNYTCESGAQMYVDLCCSREEIVCKGEKPGAAETPYEEILEECQEEVARGKSMQAYFECISNQCPTASRSNFGSCKDYWP